MNNEIIKNSPYYDDYDESKEYVQILPLPGRVAQSREFSQAQSIQLDLLKRLGDTILKEGSMIDGMGYSKDPETNIVTVQPGKVYIQGLVHNFSGGTVAITGVGEESVGVVLNSSIVTEVEDKTLRDPAQGYANYSQPGAHRLKAECKLVANDESAYILYSFVDGILKIDPVRPQLDSVIELLARRTHDETGNYRVNGLDIWAEDRNSTTVGLNIDGGKAYVKGHEVTKPTGSRIIVDKPTETRTVFNEPKTYKASTLKYFFNNNPVSEVLKCVSTVEITENISRGAVQGGSDNLPKSPVVEIVSIKASGKTYVEGTDYQLIADSVDWSLAGEEPAVGSTYQATFRYNKVMDPEVDYKIASEGDDGDKKFYIQFLSGDKPVENTQIITDYKFSLARADLIVLNQEGDVKAIPGAPDTLSRVSEPLHTDIDTLKLGVLVHLADGTNPVAKTDTISKLDMADLQKIVTRVKDMEYNQALTALDQEILNSEAGLALKGIFSDSFSSTSRGDLGHLDFTVAYNLNTASIELPMKQMSISHPDITSVSSSISTWGRLVTAPYTEQVSLTQPYATATMNVNPYNVFTQMGVLNVTPSVDNWIDETVVLEGTTVENKVVTAVGWSRGQSARNQFGDITNWSSSGMRQTGSTETVSRDIMDNAIEFMRQRQVEINATNLVENSDNLELIFDGRKVDLTPKGTTTSGTSPGTVRSDASGNVKATFNIPANVRTGTRELLLRNNRNVAATSYTAQGTNRTIRESVLVTRVTINTVDPLAQSFGFMQNHVLSSMGLYFSKKDTSKNAIVQIRNMVNGLPGQEIHAETVLRPNQVNISDTGTLETKVSFDAPVVCSAGVQYCVVILTDSDEYEMFVGEIGKRDLADNKIVTKQPYNEGVLFSSSNAITWTPHQTKDLKFKAYTAKFAKTGVIEFDPIINTSADKIIALADHLTPENTGCEWVYRTESGGQYKPISPYEDLDLPTVTNFIQLKATFEASNNMSPILAIDSFNLLSFVTEKTGSYIGRNTQFSQAYTEVKQIFEARVPSGCSVVPQFSYNGGTEWHDATLSGSKQISQEFTQFTYITPVEVEKNAKNFKARINIVAPNSVARPQVRRFMNIVK